MLKQYSLKALQIALNTAISLNDSATEILPNIEGKVLEVVINPLNAHFFMQFQHNELQLLEHYEGEPDATIYSNPIGLIRLSFLPASKARSLFNDKVRIVGDVELGQTVKALFDYMEIDWEGHLAHFTGDVVAHHMGSLLRKGVAFQQQFRSSMQHNMSEYLHEELQVFPSKNELNEFYNDVDELSLALERLHANINFLLQTYERN
jgi:ubiquinone biosynthesis protein UbiJ